MGSLFTKNKKQFELARLERCLRDAGFSVTIKPSKEVDAMKEFKEFLENEKTTAFDSAMAYLKNSDRTEPYDEIARGVVLGRLEMIKKVIAKVEELERKK